MRETGLAVWGRWQNRCADARVKVGASKVPQVAGRWSQDTAQKDVAVLQTCLQGIYHVFICLVVKTPRGK